MKNNIVGNESAKIKASKGIVQGFNGVFSVNKKCQIINDATVF